MFIRYLRRELSGRRKATIIVAAGFAVAIALVMVVTSLSAGVRDAQAQALQSVYGVGTDLTVTAQQEAPEPGAGAPEGNRFDFGAGEGATQDGTTSLAASRLTVARTVVDESLAITISDMSDVSRATAVLSMTNVTFTGEMPDPSQNTMPDRGAAPDGTSGAPAMPGGPDGAGGSSFGIDSFSVFGVEPGTTDVGPLSATTLADGRLLSATDAEANVAVVDQSYATAQGISVGDSLTLGDAEFDVVGLVASASAQAETAANVYIPLAVAQNLTGQEGKVSTIYVQATSAGAISTVADEIATENSDVTVSSQSDLAQTISGSLQTASTLMSQLGLWLAIVVLAVALALAVLFTLSGVSRRTRELGTLKALGWSHRRVMGQVAGESVAQGLIGAVAGLVLGMVVILTITLIRPTISAGSAGGETPGALGEPGGRGGMPGGLTITANTDLVLTAPITGSVIFSALAIAIIGGLVAGIVGGWRAARLSPADALRTVN